MRMSSANRRCEGRLKPRANDIGEIAPSLDNLERKRLRKSSAIPKRRGESGSPWRTPLPQLKNPNGEPLCNIEILADWKIDKIHPQKVSEKPKHLSTSKIKFQSIVSKAFLTSILRAILPCFDLFFSPLKPSEASAIHSWIFRPLINPNWLPETMREAIRPNLSARIFVQILNRKFPRIIGLNLSIVEAFSVLGRRIRKFELMLWARIPVLKNSWIARVKSLAMMSQQHW